MFMLVEEYINKIMAEGESRDQKISLPL